MRKKLYNFPYTIMSYLIYGDNITRKKMNENYMLKSPPSKLTIVDPTTSKNLSSPTNIRLMLQSLIA
jgi:hypothetical protein